MHSYGKKHWWISTLNIFGKENIGGLSISTQKEIKLRKN